MKRLLERVLSYFPSPLPVGLTEHYKWADSILSLSSVPDNDSTRYTVAVMIMHLSPTTDRRAKQFFIRSLNKAAANEVANAVIMDLKEKQKAETKAAQEAKAVTNNIGTPNAQLERDKEVLKA